MDQPKHHESQSMAGRTFRTRARAVKNLRIQKGWGVKDLARRAVCSEKTIENIERGKEVFLSTLTKVSKALGVSPDVLLESPERLIGPDHLPDRNSRDRGGVQFEVTIKLSVPSFEEFDETNDLMTLIAFLQGIAGRRNPIDVDDVTDGSVVIKLVMNEEAFKRISGRFKPRFELWGSKGFNNAGLKGIKVVSIVGKRYDPRQTKQEPKSAGGDISIDKLDE